MCYLLFLTINRSSWSGFVTQLPRVYNPIYFWYELTETEAEFQWLVPSFIIWHFYNETESSKGQRIWNASLQFPYCKHYLDTNKLVTQKETV